MYWCNFKLPNVISERKNPDLSRTKKVVDALSVFHNYDFRKYKGNQRMNKIARNLVDYEAGKTILEVVMGIYNANNTNQATLF